MRSSKARVVKERSFDHKGRIYDVAAFIEPDAHNTINIEVTSNGHDVRYTYPDGVHATQRHQVMLDLSRVERQEDLNVLDYTMDNAELLVRRLLA